MQLFIEFLVRWLHILSGVMWIGLLYYFNFVQGAFMAEAAAAAKPEVTTKLLPRALWWFRWAAMSTLIFGLILIAMLNSDAGAGYWRSERGVSIIFGGIMGIIMWFNVWFIIWPNQKVIIAANKEALAKGGAPQGLGNRPRVAFLASRFNTMLSIPMLFFMAASTHNPWHLIG